VVLGLIWFFMGADSPDSSKQTPTTETTTPTGSQDESHAERIEAPKPHDSRLTSYRLFAPLSVGQASETTAGKTATARPENV